MSFFFWLTAKIYVILRDQNWKSGVLPIGGKQQRNKDEAKDMDMIQPWLNGLYVCGVPSLLYSCFRVVTVEIKYADTGERKMVRTEGTRFNSCPF